MKRALETITEMENAGVIGRHAIVGSVALIYYAEPVDTQDVDIFFLHSLAANEIFSMEKIYEYLGSRGFQPQDFTVVIGGVRVQLVPSTGKLSDEAINTAKKVILFEVETRVATPEYLIALKLVASRPKDFVHILHLLSTTNTPINFDLLGELIDRFDLRKRWDRFLEISQWTK